MISKKDCEIATAGLINYKTGMRKFIVVLSLIVPLATFAQKNTKSFEINGTVDSLEDGTEIYLNTWVSSKKTDTAIIRNGKFKFVGKISYPSPAVINFGEQNPNVKFFWLENIKISFTGFGKNLDKAVIKSSGDNKEFEDYKNLTDSFKGNDSLINAFNVSYIKNHPDSYLSGVALLMAMGRVEHVQLNSMYQSLSPKIKKSFYGEEFEKQADAITRNGITLYFNDKEKLFTKEYKKKFFDTYFEIYPALIKQYTNGPKAVTVTIDRKYGGVASASAGEITLSDAWSENNPGDLSLLKLQLELVAKNDFDGMLPNKPAASIKNKSQPDTITRNGLTLYYIDLDNSFADGYKKKLVETYFAKYPELIKGYDKNYPKAVTLFIDPDFKGIRSTYQDAIQFGADFYNQDPGFLGKIDTLISQDLTSMMQLYSSNIKNKIEPDTVITRNGFTLKLTSTDKSLPTDYKENFINAYFNKYPKLVEQYNSSSPRMIAFTFDRINGITADYKFNYTQDLTVNFRTANSDYPDDITSMLTDIVLNRNFPASYRPASNIPSKNFIVNKPDTISRNGLTLYFDDPDKSFTDAYKKRFVDTYFEQYPKLIKKYNTNSPKTLTFNINKSYTGIAVNYVNSIEFNPAWFETNPEDIDVITHELMHSVQGYGYNNVPMWVTEGIADYVRATEGINNEKGNWSMPDYNSMQNYDNSYRITARFFVWITQNYKSDFVNMLDDACRKQNYSDATWENITGKTLNELWKAYAASPVLK